MLSARLAELGFELRAAQQPLASYVMARRAGSLLYLSGHVSRSPEGVVRGVVGADIDLPTAQGLARGIALDLLASAAHSTGSVDTVAAVVRLTGYVRSAAGFDQQPAVLNAASDLFIELLGESGRHARSAVGVSELPLGAAVEIEAIFELSG